MARYVIRKIGQKKEVPGIFALTPYNGVNPLSQSEAGYSINDGICYSTFSYASGSYVPVENMNTAFSLGKDYAVYLELGISSNLQVTGARIVADKVGKNAGASGWKTYPDFYKIVGPPNITKNVGGKDVIIQISDGKRQDKCYLMLGMCKDKLDDLDNSYSHMPVASLQNSWTGYYTQYIDSNIIMMGSQISGIPVVIPFPYFGGPATSDQNKLFPKK